MRLVGRDGRVSEPLAGVPAVEARGQGGLLDLALAPDFARTRELFFCHSVLLADGAATRLVRARLAEDNSGLQAVTPILDATPAQASGRNHFGCRIAFGPDGALFLSTGDRYSTRMRAQRLDDLAGKVLRVSRDGAPSPTIPSSAREARGPRSGRSAIATSRAWPSTRAPAACGKRSSALAAAMK